MVYLQRNIKTLAEKYLCFFPVVGIIGARQSGKTTFVQNLCPNWKYFDLESIQDYHLIRTDPILFFEQYNNHVIIDEAQRYPELFNILRGVIDAQKNKVGRFILTGSSSPDLLSNVADSLAGRIGLINLGTLKANEIYQKPLSDFYTLFQNPLEKNFKLPKIHLENRQMRKCWFSGGYPHIVNNPDPEFRAAWLKNYQETYINRDIIKLFPRLNAHAYQRFIDCLSGLSGTIINKSEIARILAVSEGAIREYLQIAQSTFIWRNIHYYTLNPVKSIIKRPKGYLRDSGLLHHLKMIDNIDALLKSSHCGYSFEGFVIEEILLGLEASGISNLKYSYYRTRSGQEIDLVLQGPFGILPIAIKMSSTVYEKHLKSLHRFIETYDLPFGLLINQGAEVCWISKTVLQIPIGCL